MADHEPLQPMEFVPPKPRRGAVRCMLRRGGRSLSPAEEQDCRGCHVDHAHHSQLEHAPSPRPLETSETAFRAGRDSGAWHRPPR